MIDAGELISCRTCVIGMEAPLGSLNDESMVS